MPLRPLLVRRADKNARLPERLQNHGHRAPLSAQEVVQVTIVPFSHEMQASTQCFMLFGLNGRSFAAQNPLVALAVSSSPGEQEASAIEQTMMSAKARMLRLLHA